MCLHRQRARSIKLIELFKFANKIGQFHLIYLINFEHSRFESFTLRLDRMHKQFQIETFNQIANEPRLHLDAE